VAPVCWICATAGLSIDRDSGGQTCSLIWNQPEAQSAQGDEAGPSLGADLDVDDVPNPAAHAATVSPKCCAAGVRSLSFETRCPSSINDRTNLSEENNDDIPARSISALHTKTLYPTL
jgi:hypothetical protein